MADQPLRLARRGPVQISRFCSLGRLAWLPRASSKQQRLRLKGIESKRNPLSRLSRLSNFGHFWTFLD